MMLGMARARNWQDNRQRRGRYETTEPRFNDQVHVAAHQNFRSAMTAPAVGIDLDTTYSCIGVLCHRKVEIIDDDQGNHITPNYVVFTKMIGDAAKNLIMNPADTTFYELSCIDLRRPDLSLFYAFRASRKSSTVSIEFEYD